MEKLRAICCVLEIIFINYSQWNEYFLSVYQTPFIGVCTIFTLFFGGHFNAPNFRIQFSLVLDLDSFTRFRENRNRRM